MIKRLINGAAIAVIFFMLAACDKTPPEEAILANIKASQKAVENRDAGDAVKYLADNFSGNRGMDKQELRRMLAVIFLRHKNINVVITRMDIKINEYDPSTATMEGVVVATGADRLLPSDGRIFKVNGDWVLQNDEWKLAKISWE
jgi:hypothetical protein